MKCPVCGRTIGTYTGDPIFATPTLSTSQYEGFTHILAQHIKELQDERRQQEIDNGVSPLTTFSVIDTTNLFQNWVAYITELRESTEKILDVVGMTLEDFLSKDEDGQIISIKTNWSDPNLEATRYQCKAIHLEDLRHFITTAIWIEKWEGFPDHIYLNETHIETGLDWTYNFPCEPIFGNKGDWGGVAVAARIAGTGAKQNDSARAECDLTSEKLTLHLETQSLKTIQGTGGINTGIINQIRIDNNDVDYLLKPTTIFSFDLTNYINIMLGGAYLNRIRITLSVGEHVLTYDITASLSTNVYNDYTALYGIPPPETTIDAIQFALTSRILCINVGDFGQSELQCTLDNIKFSG